MEWRLQSKYRMKITHVKPLTCHTALLNFPAVRCLRSLRCSLRSRRLEVVGERENGRARGRHACLLLARPFFLGPTTSKRLLRRLLKLHLFKGDQTIKGLVKFSLNNKSLDSYLNSSVRIKDHLNIRLIGGVFKLVAQLNSKGKWHLGIVKHWKWL